MSVLPNQTEKPVFVRSGFNEIASRYDFLNDVMTFGMHRRWKQETVDRLGVLQSGVILDLCSGTGDLAFIAARKHQDGLDVAALDFSANMMEAGRRKAKEQNVNNIGWINSDACSLPFHDSSFDGVTVGFGLRNVVSLERCLEEIHRVLKPGAKLVSLDTAGTEWKFIAPFYGFYMRNVIPRIGRLLTGSQTMYQYLTESAEAFHQPQELCAHFSTCGFINTGYRFCPRIIGGAALVWGEKPSQTDRK